MSDFVTEMRRHLALAVAERERLSARIQALDVLIAQEAGPTASSPAAYGGDGTVLSLPDAVTTALRGIGGELNFSDLLKAVNEVRGGEVNDKSLRGALSRVEREGKIVRPRRGWYALASDTEGSAVAAAEPSAPVPATQEGGGASGTDAHRVRDDPPAWQTEHLDHDLGAPVEGA